MHITELTEKIVRIRFMQSQSTGLLAGVSDDLYGLMIHGRTIEEILERAPGVIKDMLEADGKVVASVEAETDEESNLESVTSAPPEWVRMREARLHAKFERIAA